uniref:Retrovirus-related Pol polyprotein from transposon TNT 1-94 n=1 Tax=Cajanus cajan TaxID=3821 RepID=A0A151SY71_CAJCA|nr:hypothetical protein KK1_015191 [Cajanus cajan]
MNLFSILVCNSKHQYFKSLLLAVPFTLHSHFSFIPTFNGLNFSKWSEQIQFYLGVMDLDLALREEKPSAITDSST